MVTLKKIIVLIAFCIGVLSINAQDLKVVSSGQGITENEATKAALRNALEDAFGAFISSSTKIENDILVSDEIVSLTQGNIKSYNIITSLLLADNLYSVTIESVVSLNKLSSYCESKGMSVSLNGEAFGMEFAMREFNRLNEIKVLKNLCVQLLSMNPNIYDCKLNVTEPQIADPNPFLGIKKNSAVVKVLVRPRTNSNYAVMEKHIKQTLATISLKKAEIKTYKKLGIPFYNNHFYSNDTKMYYLRDENAINILKNFFFKFRELVSGNWLIIDSVKGNITFDDNIKRDEISFGLTKGKDKDFGFLLPEFENIAVKLVLVYSMDEVSQLKSINIEPFYKERYETKIKPQLLKIISRFDDI